MVILCTPSTKGGQGLRAGAHLVNHGCSVTAYLPQTDNPFPANFDFHLRLFSASGGKVARSADDLPEHADLIVDALTDNDTSSGAGGSKDGSSSRKPNRYDPQIQEAVSWALSCSIDPSSSGNTRTTANNGNNFSEVSTKILSIDLPSNTDSDSGQVVPGATWSITPAAVVSLGLIKSGSAYIGNRYRVYLADIGLSPVSLAQKRSRVPCRLEGGYRASDCPN